MTPTPHMKARVWKPKIQFVEEGLSIPAKTNINGTKNRCVRMMYLKQGRSVIR
ncbi:hypothetical protein [Segatella copri]|uniref:hypothetical protein n=1 Tax=Segatella copri TaxID=165179 RepID=UPI00159613F7|nr:hypothetical protein [Segatella copri]